MTLQQIRYMITIAETGSLGKAAEKLYVSQPSLTSAVKEMEKELGMTLFHRGSRGVTLTTDGLRLLPYARQVEGQYLNLMEAFGKIEKRKTHFAVSTQHYSFAVKAFVQMAQQVDVAEYELAIRETRTQEVISDVAGMRSEIGVLYMNESNRKPLMKLLDQEGLVFRPMIVCSAYVYLWKKHPLAKRKELTLEDLHPYPCLAFEQGDAPFYFSEELMSTEQYPRLKLIENPHYSTCNNISSLYVARDHLKDCIILDGDQIIYNSKILQKEAERSGYNAVWTEKPTNEWLLSVKKNIITSCSRIGGNKGWQLYSVSRWSAEDGKKLKNHLEIEFENGNWQIFWDDIALFCYPKEYSLGITKMNKEDIVEIDNLEELIKADPSYLRWREKL